MQDQSNQTNPQPVPEDTAKNASAPASREADKGQQESEWKQKMQALLKKCTIPLTIAGALFLTVGVPIIINELYKRPGYVTMWSAADMLNYYGTILGTVVTVGTLVVTILFTRLQIRRESYLKEEKEKWRTVEKLFDTIIENINPLSLLNSIEKEIANTERISSGRIVNFIQLYQLACDLAVDQIEINHACCSPEMKELADRTIQISNKLKDQSQKGDEFYSALWALESANKLPPDLRVIKTQLIKRIRKFTTEMKAEYNNTYKPLLEIKQRTFSEIYDNVQTKADTMLYFWRKH